ncbi:MAG: PAS domain-containing sensor histidine kinase [bacterium]
MPYSLHTRLAGLLGGRNPRWRWIAALVWTMVVTFCVMAIYEIGKMWLWPDVTLWQSHLITILFTAVLTGVITHVALRTYHQLLQQTMGEIAERLRVSDELVQERNFMRALMENTPDHIYFKDKDGHYMRVNKALADAFGLQDASRVVGKTASEFFTGEFAQLSRDDEQQIISTGLPLIAKEERETWPDGRATWVSSSKMPLCDVSGRVIGTFGLSRDISQQKNTEERLRQVSRAVEQSPSLVVITDTNGTITYVNPRFCEVTGFTPQEVIGQKPDIFKSQHAPEQDFGDLWKTITSGEEWRGEFLNVKKGGDTYWGSALISPIRDGVGQITHYIELMEDVTERKRAESAQAELVEGMRTVLSMADELIACPDVDTLFRRAVELSRERLGLERCSIWIDMDRHVAGTYGTSLERETTDERHCRFPKDEVWNERLRRRGADDPRSTIVEEPYSEWNGEKMVGIGYGWIAVTPIQSSGREVIGVFCNDAAISRTSPDRVKQEIVTVFCSLLGNIVARKRAEAERVEAEHAQRESLERADRLNSLGMFAAGMAHEINNPLQGMLSHVHSVKRGLPKDFQGREGLDMVERGIETIANLVRRLLALGTQDPMGELGVSNEAIDFVTRLLESQLKRAKVKLIIERKQPGKTLAMPRRELIQVLLNLVINAKDAMPQGGRITIASDEEEGRAIIRISDTGAGIRPDIRGKIFTPFFTTKGTKGTGLGLSVAESLVRSCGGAISFDSKPGQGTTFTLRIPLAVAGAGVKS